VQGRGGFDLHTHSRVSDGTEVPAEVVRQAVAAGLSAIALTDHDSTAGWAEATAEAERTGLGLIPGIELSSRQEWRSVHVLGYLIDPASPALVAETARIREERRSRARRIVDRIGEDYPLSWDDVLAQTTPGSTVGRPHIADALVALGIEYDRSGAFAGILHPRRGYIEPHYAPTPLAAVRLIVEAGGVPVLAHPGAAGRGLELHHRENTPDGAERVAELAERFGLAVTGSSDYHGSGKPNRLGENTTDPAVVERILALGTGVPAVPPRG
jgi:predicted metal-dependent phosphoesterase TrpH